MIPAKLAPMATTEAVPMPRKSRLWKVDASGANCTAGDFTNWVPFSFRSPEECARYIRGLLADLDLR